MSVRRTQAFIVILTHRYTESCVSLHTLLFVCCVLHSVCYLEMDHNFDLNNLPNIQPYSSPGFALTTFDNKLEMVCAAYFQACSILYDFIKREGQRPSETLFQFTEQICKAQECMGIHRHVEKLLFAAMYAKTYDMNGHSFVGDLDDE